MFSVHTLPPGEARSEASRMEYDAAGEREAGAAAGEGWRRRREKERNGSRRGPRPHGVGGRTGGGGMEGR